MSKNCTISTNAFESGSQLRPTRDMGAFHLLFEFIIPSLWWTTKVCARLRVEFFLPIRVMLPFAALLSGFIVVLAADLYRQNRKSSPIS